MQSWREIWSDKWDRAYRWDQQRQREFQPRISPHSSCKNCNSCNQWASRGHSRGCRWPTILAVRKLFRVFQFIVVQKFILIIYLSPSPSPRMMGLFKGSSKALCFVIDTTSSMKDDIATVKTVTSTIINRNVGTANEPSLYILVPFNDPGRISGMLRFFFWMFWNFIVLVYILSFTHVIKQASDHWQRRQTQQFSRMRLILL